MISNKFKIFWRILLDRDRKTLRQIFKDIDQLRKTYSIDDLIFYYTCLMYKKHCGNINAYVSRKSILKIKEDQLNTAISELNDKIRFAKIMRDNKIDAPCYLGEIKKGVLTVYKEKIKTLINEDKAVDIFKKWVQSHENIFVKPINSNGGKGIFRFNQVNPIDLTLLNIKECYIIEKGLIQHSELNKINPNCINTLRVNTFYKDGKVKPQNIAALRMGLGKSHMDNGSLGGIFVDYDLVNNKLGKVAYSMPMSGGKSYYWHPNTHFIFNKNELPYPDKVIALVAKVATLFPNKNFIGWDIAYTVEGPVVIEGNNNPHVSMTQIYLKGLKNNPIFKELYKPIFDTFESAVL